MDRPCLLLFCDLEFPKIHEFFADKNKAVIAAATDDAFNRLIGRKYLKRAR